MTRLAVAIRPPRSSTPARLPRATAAGVTWSVPSSGWSSCARSGTSTSRLVTRWSRRWRRAGGRRAGACTSARPTQRLGGQWLGVPVAGLDDLVAVVYDATVAIVPVTIRSRSAPSRLARGRVPADLAGDRSPAAGSPTAWPWSPTARPRAGPGWSTWPSSGSSPADAVFSQVLAADPGQRAEALRALVDVQRRVGPPQRQVHQPGLDQGQPGELGEQLAAGTQVDRGPGAAQATSAPRPPRSAGSRGSR